MLFIKLKDHCSHSDFFRHTDADSLKEAIKAVQYVEGKATYTGEAMQKALPHFLAKMQNDKETAKVSPRG